MANSQTDFDLDSMPPAMAWQMLLLMLLASTLGAFAAVAVLPAWLPGLSESLTGPDPKAYWYLSRSSAIVAYGLLWFSMALGVSITNKLARVWPGGPTAFDLHQHVSLLGLCLALFHGLILMGDRYIGFGLWQVMVPFASAEYRPVWVGLGQVAFYLLALVGLSFYVRRSIGHRAWRIIHYTSFAVFALALAHGLTSGTDSGTSGVQALYWISAGSLVFLTTYRFCLSRIRPAR